MRLLSLTRTLLLVFMILPLVAACSADPAAVTVEAAERAREIAIATEDDEAYGELTSDDLLVVNDRGAVVTKDERIGTIGSGEERRIRRSNSGVEIRRYGEVALVMGRSVRQREGEESHEYFTRIWVWRRGQWQMVSAHHTDITARVIGDDHPKFTVPDQPVPTLPIGPAPPGAAAEAEVRRALDEEHRAYWRKDPESYLQYAGPDLLRIAENGVRTRDELIAGMLDNSRLPRPPSQHQDLRLRVYGNVAVAAYLDHGEDNFGLPASAFFTVVFARRDRGWQMVHIQSTAVKG